MLTRPGSEPGPEWMRRLGGNPRQLRKAILSIIVFVGVTQLAAIVVGDIAVYRADGRHVRLYNSPIQIVGMPLSSMGGRAHGVIAYGGLATGIIAVGGGSAGVISFGGISVGFLSLGGLSVGWLTLGAVAGGQAALGSQPVSGERSGEHTSELLSRLH